MIIACPSCKRRYVVKKSSIPKDGQTVRCTACGNEWLQKPVDEVSGLEKNQPNNDHNKVDDGFLTNSKSIKAPNNNQSKPEKVYNNNNNKTGNNIIGYGFFAFILLIVLSGLLFYFKSNYIINKWPSSTAIYKIVGIEKNSHSKSSLEIKIKKMTLQRSKNKLNIQGVIVNASDKAIPTKSLFVDGYGKCHNVKLWNKPFVKSRIHKQKGKQCVLKTWNHKLKQRILGKEKYPFDIKINDIPKNVDSVVVRF